MQKQIQMKGRVREKNYFKSGGDRSHSQTFRRELEKKRGEDKTNGAI